MYGARAVLKEVVEAYPRERVSVLVVWMPMVPGDDEQSARSTGMMYAGHGVRQYYDAERKIGTAYHRDVFPDCISEALSVMPKDHPLFPTLRDWAELPADRPLWDAVLFYQPGVEWIDVAPRPTGWSKQVGFVGPDSGDVTGIFFRNDCSEPTVDSDWFREVRQAMIELVGSLEHAAPQTESESLAPGR